MKKILVALACAGAFASHPALAQQAARPAGYKDPGIATLVSVLVPGGGQLYAGDTGKGITLLVVGLGGTTLGFTMAAGSGNTTPALVGYAASLGAWIYGIADASGSARRMNAKNGLAGIIPDNVAPIVAPDGVGGTQVGVTIRL